MTVSNKTATKLNEKKNKEEIRTEKKKEKEEEREGKKRGREEEPWGQWRRDAKESRRERIDRRRAHDHITP